MDEQEHCGKVKYHLPSLRAIFKRAPICVYNAAVHDIGTKRGGKGGGREGGGGWNRYQRLMLCSKGNFPLAFRLPKRAYFHLFLYFKIYLFTAYSILTYLLRQNHVSQSVIDLKENNLTK